MSENVNFLSKFETASVDAGLAIRLTTVSPIDGPTGPIPQPALAGLANDGAHLQRADLCLDTHELT